MAPHDHGWDDPDDDLTGEVEPSGVDALGDYARYYESGYDTGELATSTQSSCDEPADSDPHGPLFSATNPAGTVTVTAYLNGQVQQVDLAPQVSELTEPELAHEIRAVAAVAAVKASAALHTFVYDLLCEAGQDRGSAREFVAQSLYLPTPEQAVAAEAEFAAHYARDAE